MAKRRTAGGITPDASVPEFPAISRQEEPLWKTEAAPEVQPPAEQAAQELTQIEAAPVAFAEPEQKPLFNIRVLENNVSECLRVIDDEVMHAYVTQLSELVPIEPDFDEEMLRKEPYQFFHITKLVYEQDEFSVAKLSTIFQTLSEKNCTLVLLIRNQKDENGCHRTRFYLGVRDHEEEDYTGTLRQMLQMSLKGQFPGSNFDTGFSIEDMHQITEELNRTTGAVSSVSCIPDFKQDKDVLENKDFLQGLEKFVISMQNKEYTAVIVAEAIPFEALSEYRKQLESIYTQLSAFSTMQYQISTSSGSSTAETQQDGKAYTQTSGTSDTQGTNSNVSQAKTTGTSDTTGTSHTEGQNSSEAEGTSKTSTDTNTESQSHTEGTTKTNTVSVGANANVGKFIAEAVTTTLTGGASAGLKIGKLAQAGINGAVSRGRTKSSGTNGSLGVNVGYSHSVARSKSDTTGTSHSTSLADTVSRTLTKGVSSSDTASQSHTTQNSLTDTVSSGTTTQHGTSSSYSEAFNFGHAETITSTFGNSQGVMLQSENLMISNMLERIKIQIQRIDECESIGMWNCAAYFLGKHRSVSEVAASTYRSLVSGERSGVERSAVNTWTDKNCLPLLKDYITHFCHPQFAYNAGESSFLVSPASLISTKELAIQMSLPRKSVCGLPVTEHATFGQQIVRNDMISDNSAPTFRLGRVYHLNATTEMPVELDVNSLTMHTFVTGSTGAGKSNTVYHILDQLRDRRIPFLVIEPAKGEYKSKFNGALVFGTNPNQGALLKLNPFSFPQEIHIQEHIDRLTELFNVCWPMYAAMPAVLKDSIIRAYEAAGWDMNRSVNPVSGMLYPTFEDVLRELERVVQEADYSKDTGSDYKGALKTRLKSLTNGINGMIFSGQEIDNAELFDSETIVDLSRVGSMETKSLIMGILVLKLQEYRMSGHNETDSALRHVTVLEEAHHLLKKTSTEQGQETANLQGKSVEMLTNAIAEMRTYGEGFIIADQAPDLLDTAVIRNTNTKIIMRLLEGRDRDITGMSMALDEAQVTELSKLPQGVAAVYQNNWQEAVLCAVSKYQYLDLIYQKTERKACISEKEILRLLLTETQLTPALKDAVLLSDAPARIRRQLLQHFDQKNLVFEWAMADYITNRFRWEMIFDGTNRTCNTIEELGERMLANISTEFSAFSDDERRRICYYICRKAHELFPENPVIEKVRVEYFKGW